MASHFFVFHRDGFGTRPKLEKIMSVRGIRGATTVDQDTPEAILSATQELLETIRGSNPDLKVADIASIWFTLTDDLRSEFPAKAARQIGWLETPLMCAREIPVPGSLPKCVRVLIHWNTNMPPSTIRHIYLGKATQLRPDLGTAAKSQKEKAK